MLSLAKPAHRQISHRPPLCPARLPSCPLPSSPPAPRSCPALLARFLMPPGLGGELEKKVGSGKQGHTFGWKKNVRPADYFPDPLRPETCAGSSTRVRNVRSVDEFPYSPPKCRNEIYPKCISATLNTHSYRQLFEHTCGYGGGSPGAPLTGHYF